MKQHIPTKTDVDNIETLSLEELLRRDEQSDSIPVVKPPEGEVCEWRSV